MDIKQQLDMQAMYDRQMAAPAEEKPVEKPAPRGRKAKAEEKPVDEE